jgi:hypothetical protein
MGLFWNLVDSFSRGYVAAADDAAAINNNMGRSATDNRRIEGLCRQLGWSIDDRTGDTIILHFTGPDPLEPVRKVFIDNGDEQLVSFTVYSFARMPAEDVPDEIIGYLLRQNTDIVIGAWQVLINKKEEAVFRLVYRALGAGLSAESFKEICASMGGDAAQFDKKMQAAGLLRV